MFKFMDILGELGDRGRQGSSPWVAWDGDRGIVVAGGGDLGSGWLASISGEWL